MRAAKRAIVGVVDKSAAFSALGQSMPRITAIMRILVFTLAPHVPQDCGSEAYNHRATVGNLIVEQSAYSVRE